MHSILLSSYLLHHRDEYPLNGAGKTTFIKLLCRLYDTTDGEILLDNVDIREYDYNDRLKVQGHAHQKI